MKRFTLIELLIVIAIIGILVSILLPSLGKARYMSRKVVCATNLKQNGVGLTLFNKEYNGAFPRVQNHHGRAPYTTRVARWNNGWKWYNLGQVYQEGFVSNPEVLFCPQNEVNGDTKFTHDYNQRNGSFNINSSDYYIRVSYHLLLNKMSTSARRSLRMHQMENDQLLLNDFIENKNAVPHRMYTPGWNYMKPDISVTFKYSKKIWSILEGNNLDWNWNLTETVKEQLLD
jgi:prepilin-type N-terminal cleavage/methylation domain-containing protein